MLTQLGPQRHARTVGRNFSGNTAHRERTGYRMGPMMLRDWILGIALLAGLSGTIGAQEARNDNESVAQRFQALETLGFRAFLQKKYDVAIRYFEDQIATFADHPRPYYNIACAYALKGETYRACSWLRIAIRRGWRDLEWLERDGDFDKVRDSSQYRAAIQFLRDVKRRDPDPMPRSIAIRDVPRARSAQAIVRATAIQSQLLRDSQALRGAHEQRKQLFALWDRKIAMLTRYLTEAGDAPDAPMAARVRVETALQYLNAGDARRPRDVALRRTAALYAIGMAKQFVNSYAGSTEMQRVRSLEAYALAALPDRKTEAISALHSVVSDYPGSAAAGVCLATLCKTYARDGNKKALRKVWMSIMDHIDVDEAKSLLPEAHLLALGVSERVRKAAQSTIGKQTLYVIVEAHDRDAEGLLKHARAKSTEYHVAVFVVSAEHEQAEQDWIAEHTKGLLVIPQAIWMREELGPVALPFSCLSDTAGNITKINPNLSESTNR